MTTGAVPATAPVLRWGRASARCAFRQRFPVDDHRNLTPVIIRQNRQDESKERATTTTSTCADGVFLKVRGNVVQQVRRFMPETEAIETAG